MLGMVYLLLCFLVGYVICSFVFPKLNDAAKITFRGEAVDIPSLMLLLPSWYLMGTLCVTWMVYLLGCFFSAQEQPLSYANTIVFIVLGAAGTGGILFLKIKKKEQPITLRKKFYYTEYIYFGAAALLSAALMWQTFYVKDGMLNVGLSVFSDFSPHLTMIRSFSYGNNFPTSYGHFAGEDIRYHFMFQFLAGNLEFLGMRIDYAFNIPSFLSMVSVFSLLYVLAVKLTGRKAAGILTGLFFAFRSSPSLLRYAAGLPEGSVLQSLKDNTQFIGETPNEDWGLWNLNVYCNQRHLAFALAVLLFVLILCLPLFYEQRNRVLMDRKFLKNSLFQKAGWISGDYGVFLVIGIMLGGIAFWNGAVLVCTLSVLFVLAIFSDRRLNLLLMAGAATGLSLLQSAFFIEESAVSPSWFFGFIAENKTIPGVFQYILDLTGILFFVLLTAFVLVKGAEKYMIAAFLVPFILAFTLSLTVDVTVNHKNIMLSFMLLGIFAAWLITELMRKKEISAKIFAGFLVLLLTGTGIYDFITVMKRNADGNNLTYDLKDELTLWVKENSDSKDIFLTSNYYMHPLTLGGAMLYDGWQYYAWSAGYDTQYRDELVSEMYEASTPDELLNLTEQEKIRFIVVDYNNRYAEEYVLNEAVIEDTFEKVYESGEGGYLFTIYDTKKIK